MSGLLITLLLLAVYPQKPGVVILPGAIVALFVASCAYHWLPVSLLRQKIDHLAIGVVIAVTYLPFWLGSLSVRDIAHRCAILAILFVGVCAAKVWFISWHKTGGILFLAMGLFVTGVSFGDVQSILPYSGRSLFWFGVWLYLIQFGIYSFRVPDLLPGRFGYRETQHLVLVSATTLHSLVVLQYL